MRRSDYLVCYDKGRRLASRQFVVFVHTRRDDTATWRVGMAVTKKLGNAVARNRIKRVLREFFRTHQALIPPSVDLVVIPKKHVRAARMTLAMAVNDLVPVLQGLHQAGRVEA